MADAAAQPSGPITMTARPNPHPSATVVGTSSRVARRWPVHRGRTDTSQMAGRLSRQTATATSVGARRATDALWTRAGDRDNSCARETWAIPAASELDGIGLVDVQDRRLGRQRRDRGDERERCRDPEVGSERVPILPVLEEDDLQR